MGFDTEVRTRCPPENKYIYRESCPLGVVVSSSSGSTSYDYEYKEVLRLCALYRFIPGQ